MRVFFRVCLAALVAAGTMSFADAGGVVIVGEVGSTSYATIQAAVDAASDGDALLIGPGTYPGFTIQDRSLALFAAPGAVVEIDGAVEVLDLARHRTVLLSGLTVVATTPVGASEPSPGLAVRNSAGHVRVEACSLRGDHAGGIPQGAVGAPGARVIDSDRVVLSRSVFTGGTGREYCFNTFGCALSLGGLGLEVDDSTVAVSDCELLGGAAGYYEECGGDGGTGALIQTSDVWFAGSLVQGGNGEYSCIGAPGPGGDGGDGLVILSGTVIALDSTFASGFFGCGSPCGQNGEALVDAGSALTQLAGDVPQVDAARVLADTDTGEITVIGEPGSRVYTRTALQAGFLAELVLDGWWLTPTRFKTDVLLLGTIPVGGALTAPLPVASLGATSSGLVATSQLYVIDAQGTSRISAPFHRLVLDGDGMPDCDMNGVLDYLDAIQSPSLDCNRNLVLDACEVAAATVPDCNANGVPDSCDVASETSTDLDVDGVPDECQPAITLWVDASAPGGGDGSQAAPFQTLGAALSAATAQTVLVLVHDGLYVGPSNRELDFGGKNLLFKSIGGAASCVIDLQQAGRLATLQSGEGGFTGWRGFTIRNGLASEGGALRVDGSDVNVRDCVIENCAASGASGGGAVYLVQGSAFVRGCELSGNSAASGTGGAVRIVDGYLELVLSNIRGSTAREGGAIALTGNGRAYLGHSRLLENAATAGSGGAIHGYQSVWSNLGFLNLVDCLIAGNSATGRGGGVYVRGMLFGGNSATLRLRETTLVDNTADGRGGGLFAHEWVWVRPWNSILWGNSAPLGNQAAYSMQPFGCSFNLRASALEGGTADIYNPAGASVSTFMMITSDPSFADPDGPDDDPATFLDNDYTLGPASPCIDAGDTLLAAFDAIDVDGNGVTFELTPLDLNLAPRLLDDPSVPDTGSGGPPVIDMGAYEQQ